MLAFAPSIAILSLVQASLIAVPSPTALPIAHRLASRWWALTLPGSVVVVIAGIAIDPGLADALTYLALVAVPVLAAFALAAVVTGAKPSFAAATVPLFVVACGPLGSLVGQAAALVLTALACLMLGSLVVAFVPARWLKLGIYAMAIVDTCLVAADLLQSPNGVLNAAAPAAGLPQLQFAQFGSAVLGFGDLFIAGVLGALLANQRALQLRAAGIAATLALAFDLLFFLVAELPATVPIALALAVLELSERGRSPARLPGAAAPPAPALLVGVGVVGDQLHGDSRSQQGR
jgi:hypothetical protein